MGDEYQSYQAPRLVPVSERVYLPDGFGYFHARRECDDAHENWLRIRDPKLWWELEVRRSAVLTEMQKVIQAEREQQR